MKLNALLERPRQSILTSSPLSTSVERNAEEGRGNRTDRANERQMIVAVGALRNASTLISLAGKLAEQTGVSLLVMNVVQLNIASERHGIPRAKLVYELMEETEGFLRYLLRRMKLKVPAHVFVCEGDPVERISEKADSMQAEAVITGVAWHPRFLSWLFLKRSRQILDQVKCPVLVACPFRKTWVRKFSPHKTENQNPGILFSFMPSSAPGRAV